MTQTQLEQYIENPSAMNDDVLEELSQLIEEYPFSSTLRMLLVKGLQNKKDISFDKQLKRTAIHVSDRKVLFDFLQETKFEEEGEVGEIEEIEEVKVQKEIEETSVEEKVTEPKKSKAKKEKNLEDQIQTASVGSQYILNVSDELPHVSELVNMSKGKKKKRKKSKKKEKAEPIDFFSFIDGSAEKKVKHNDKKRLKQFIESKEKALKGKKAIYSPEKQAKKSLEENDNLISDTLAKIFVKQKKYDKAIKTYKKLRLNYPEKSVYFAAQIKKVKGLKAKKKK